MSRGRIVVALGGNALQDSKNKVPTAADQLKVVRQTCEYLADLQAEGYESILVHGNGPQVGRIMLASEYAKDITPVMPFDVCGAMSQGYIGYHIQQAMREALQKRGLADTPVVTLVTQLVVSEDDPGFTNPTKPIGTFYSAEEAKQLAKERGWVMKEDSGRGWRRVVASPVPTDIIEMASIEKLFPESVVITCGGGGIPVVLRQDGSITGVPAVIDKDFAAELLAEKLDADILLILTEVEKVSINFGTPKQKDLDKVSVAEAEAYAEEGHFAPGSMLPKVKAAIKFIGTNPGKKAIITSLFAATDALKGSAGTHFY